MTRKGSALLIVLGMMAFMVVSAVAFSMFMRQSRLPSSFLRQRLAASQLVKAGLACAMRRIDVAIGDNPYPGIGGTVQANGEAVVFGNLWHHRVFMESQAAQNGISAGDGEASPVETVPTLTMEALAYLPPPLVDTVRYWSRRTATAEWKSLDYDAGRYAFTAVNVSDYFDVNRIRAGVMRDSSPENRISMGYLFENHDGESGGSSVDPSGFDKFVGNVTNDVFKTRLVSLADYNLALNGEGAPFDSLFCKYVKEPPSDGTYYGGAADSAKRQKFVADSWFPGPLDVSTDDIFLTDDSGQPFYDIEQSIDKMTDTADADHKALGVLQGHLDICTLSALYDYVDDDDIPISLAVPTMERAPMLTGISIVPQGLTVTLKQDRKDLPGDGKTQRELFTWSIDTLGDDPQITVGGCGVYPFRYSKSRNGGSASYKVKVFVRLFLSPDGKFADETRCKNDVSYCPPGADWKEDAQLMGAGKAYLDLVGESAALTVNTAPKTENDALIKIPQIKLSIPKNALQGVHVYGVEKKTTLDKDGNPVGEPEYLYNSEGMDKPLVYRDGKDVKNVKDDGQSGKALHLCCACRVQIVDGNGTTVDMVPAMVSDDKDYTGHDSAGRPTDNEKLCGDREPLLPVCSAEPVLKLDDFETFKNAVKTGQAVEQPKDVDLGSLAIYCEDPRYNWAPEDWYKAEGGAVSGEGWLNDVNPDCGTRGSRDIFQFVSDAGYLQSMGELQFLPYLRSFASTENQVSGPYFNSGKYDGKWHNKGNLANRDYFWQTHWSFGALARTDANDTTSGKSGDPYDWGIYDSNGGAAVSPYADEDLMMGAIANTPCDWYLASGNENMTLSTGKNFCFGGSEAPVSWTELKKVAAGVKKRVGTLIDWEKALFIDADDQLDEPRTDCKWDDDNGPFGANFGDNFTDVDRKYLYGFWRSCFANRQQLFLIFVRAEPAVMGGSSAGHTPAQLGARAVALVWREPESSIDEQTSGGGATAHPHRMRILFYHQFD